MRAAKLWKTLHCISFLIHFQFMFNHAHMFEAAIKAAPGVSFRGSISARRPGVVPMAVLAPELASKNACSC